MILKPDLILLNKLISFLLLDIPTVVSFYDLLIHAVLYSEMLVINGFILIRIFILHLLKRLFGQNHLFISYHLFLGLRVYIFIYSRFTRFPVMICNSFQNFLYLFPVCMVFFRLISLLIFIFLFKYMSIKIFNFSGSDYRLFSTDRWKTISSSASP